MPELPEVEAVMRSLRPLVRGRRIRCVHIFHPIATKPQSPAHLAKFAEGRRILGAKRHGKYILLPLDRGLIEMHFRFDGQLLWFRDAGELLRRANQSLDGVHVDVAFELDKGVLGFADQRHFGRVHHWESFEACPSLRSLGLDALSRKFTPSFLYARLSASRRPLKEFLLDQSKIAGIGNIYSAEALWHARLDPGRPANTLSRADSAKLYKAIVSVLHRALECCLDPAPDFRDPRWWFQGIEQILRAFQREGLPCRRCGRAIRRIEQGGRFTYCCLHCQK
ncbi:MAG TPA: bifunctional DNA-formamidopyrimidine glycosylase/DNA-(apurinic or apyrimidinic site) lyase [Verrucomicrobiae bacterium]|nr:bifunctional DNA-formamidopyrimidine glycosylase/DNA-(apurinic or apyrimidinic site) lyase [Verrucomicrobiae bacterium]